MTRLIRAAVHEEQKYPLGSAVLTIEAFGRALSSATTKIYLDTGNDDGKVLGPSGFQKSEIWLTPYSVEPQPDGGRIILSGETVSPINTGMNLRCRVSDDGGATFGETIIAWPAIATLGGGRSERKFGFVAGVQKKAPPAQPPIYDYPSPATEPVAQPHGEPVEIPATSASTGLDETAKIGQKKSRMPLVAIAAALVLLALAGGGYFLWGGDASKPTGQDLTNWTRKDVATYLSGNPGTGETHATGDALIKLKKIDLAFLIFRENARRGHPASSLALGKMYDPKFHSPQTSPMPQADGRIAADNYRIAAQVGLAEAQRLLGVMLSEGKDVAKNPEEAAFWLQKAAEQGDKEAKAILSKLTSS